MVAVASYHETGCLVRRYVRCKARRADGDVCNTVLFVYLIPEVSPDVERMFPTVPIEIICSDRRCRRAHTIYVPVFMERFDD